MQARLTHASLTVSSAEKGSSPDQRSAAPKQRRVREKEGDARDFESLKQ
jgi:hypothetical protein